MHDDLFQPVRLGNLTLANRIVMAPLTRARAAAGGVPTELNAQYYAQRAGAGLIVSEATNISAQGRGYAFTPGIWSAAHVVGWRHVTDAVRARGGRMFLQLWHVGRISHPSLQEGGALPVAPSAVRPEGQAFTETGLQPFVAPRALEIGEIPGIIEDYRHATRNALAAGFDGVEIHAANGYLIDQFLKDKTNRRTDRFGGSIENRTRFLAEVVAAVVAEAGGERTGIRFAPLTPSNDIADSDPRPLFLAAVERLNPHHLAYLHVVEGATQGPREVPGGFDLQELRRAFNGLYMANNGYDLALAEQARRDGLADLIAFGRPFIANPDLVERLRRGLPLTTPDRATYYGGGEQGYTDYPVADRAAAA